MPERYKILLDLDNTIISSLSRKEERRSHKEKFNKFIWENMDGEFKVFERPHLQAFLDFLFKNFDVSVWTAASKSYALFIIDNFILIKPSRKVEYVFFAHHCKQSVKKKGAQKDLSMLWTAFNLTHVYNEDNTYIIDDNQEVYETQPDRCIQVKPFEFQDRKSFADDELNKTIKPVLKRLLLKGYIDELK